MSEYKEIIHRFLTGISLGCNSRGNGNGLNLKETQRGLQPFLEHLIENSSIASEDELAQYFLHFLLEARDNYYFLWKNKADISVTSSYTIFYKVAKLFLFNYLQLICFYQVANVKSK